MFAPQFPGSVGQGCKGLCVLSFGDIWVKAESQDKSLTLLK